MINMINNQRFGCETLIQIIAAKLGRNALQLGTETYQLQTAPSDGAQE
jgi:hypothetical protein